MSRTQLQVFLVVDCVAIAMGGVAYALDPDGSVALGLAVVGGMVTQASVALRPERPGRAQAVARDSVEEGVESSS